MTNPKKTVMTIETKFNIGDSVFGVRDRRAAVIEIDRIYIGRNGKVYYLDKDNNTYDENECFTVLEDLVNYFIAGVRGRVCRDMEEEL